MLLRLMACCLALAMLAAPVSAEEAFWYTNLVGADVQAEVQAALVAAGVPAARAETLWRWADDYRQAMAACDSFRLVDGWTAAALPVVDYGDYYPASTAWFKAAGRDYADILCRLAAFQLLQDGIRADNPVPQGEWACAADEWLASDADAIAHHPLVELTDVAKQAYFTLFQPVPAPAGSDESALAQAVASAWQARGVTFALGEASLITIWIQAEDQPTAAVAHAAVLVPWGEGYLLVEKTNPQMPYQSTRFAALAQVSQYMRDALILDYGRYGLTPGPTLVMQNDQPLP